MRRAVFVIVMLLLGAATTAAVAVMALFSADRATESTTSVIVRNGAELWLVRMHEGFGLRWVNCERALAPLANAVLPVDDLPDWARLPDVVFPPDASPRIATLAVGWPMPIAARQWSAPSYQHLFPLQFEIDDGNDSLRRAAQRFREDEPGVPVRILWPGVAVDVALFAIAWGILALLLSSVWRVIFPAEAAAPVRREGAG